MRSHHRNRTLWTRAAAALLLVLPAAVSAYKVNSYLDSNQTLYLKWGDNHAGTIGGTVYWSFIPAGTSGGTYCGDACPSTSGSSINIEISPGGGFLSHDITELEAHITAMMDLWSAATGITFIKLDADSGVAINDDAAVPPATGQIRIGVFAFGATANGEAAVGYSPPPNGGTGSGDILFNSNAYYQFAPGNQGDSYDQTYAPNDIDGLILHELGHAIGLEHPDHVDGSCPIMDVNQACLGIVNRELGADDRAGAMFLYDTLFASGFE
jgi:hypothetical protein